MAETIELGIVGISNKGEYDAQTNYEKLNVVTYEGSSYCAKQNCKGILPTNTDYWQLYAEKGEKGDVGPQGPKPEKGVDYYTEEDRIEFSSEIASDVHDEVIEQVGDLVSATPLAVSSTSSMTDTSRIYVNTTNGYWYYYNGSNWVKGGIYQASVDSDETLKNSKSTYLNEKRIEDYDGMIRPTNYERGNISYNGSTLSYTDYEINKRVRTKENEFYHLIPGDIVGLDNWENAQFFGIFRRSDTNTYSSFSWITENKIIEYEGDYCFVLRAVSDEDQENTVNLGSRLFIKKQTYFKSEIIDRISTPNDIIKKYFINGTTYGGTFHDETNRITTRNLFEFDEDVAVVRTNDNFRFSVHWLDNNNVSHDTGWVNNLLNAYIIPKNTKFRILVARKNEITGEIANVDEFSQSLVLLTESKNNVENLLDDSKLSYGYIGGAGEMVGGGYPQYPLTSDFIEVEQDELLSIHAFGETNEQQWIAIAYYNENKEFISRYSPSGSMKEQKYIFRCVNDAKYIKVSYRHFYKTKIMLNKGFNFSEFKQFVNVGSKRNNIVNNHGIYAIAHRGYSSSYGAPENTLPAFILAKQNGFNFVETDIHFTSDDIPVCIHDTTVDRTTNGEGEVRSLTLAQIKSLDASMGRQGYENVRIPTLEEFIVLCRDLQLIPVIEIKMDEIPNEQNEFYMQKFYDIILKYNMQDRVIYLASNFAKIMAIRKLDPYATLAYMNFTSDETSLQRVIDTLAYIIKTPYNKVIFSCNHAHLTENLINYCKGLNMQCDVWTLYDENTMKNLNKYITGVTSEYWNYETVMKNLYN